MTDELDIADERFIALNENRKRVFGFFLKISYHLEKSVNC